MKDNTLLRYAYEGSVLFVIHPSIVPHKLWIDKGVIEMAALEVPSKALEQKLTFEDMKTNNAHQTT